MLPKLKVLYLCTRNACRSQMAEGWARALLPDAVGFDDPPRLAASASTEEQALAPYRKVRDEIRRFVENLPRTLAAEQERGA